MKAEVKDVVCDYGVFVNDELALILNSSKYANEIVGIIEKDELEHKILQSNLI